MIYTGFCEPFFPMRDLWMWGITPPPAMVALMRESSSSSPRIASCKWRGVIRFTFRSLEAFPANSRTYNVSMNCNPSFVPIKVTYCVMIKHLSSNGTITWLSIIINKGLQIPGEKLRKAKAWAKPANNQQIEQLMNGNDVVFWNQKCTIFICNPYSHRENAMTPYRP